MIVQPYDAIGRYHVHSDARPGDCYVVDILAFNGEGKCSCDDWEFRIGAALREDREPPKRFCKHIIAAREAFLESVIQRTIQASLTQPEPDH